MNDRCLPHRIRLRAAWQYCGGAEFDAARAQRVEVPDLRPPERRSGQSQVVYRRPFNRPTGLEPQSRVWLVIASADGGGPVRLNGQPVGMVDAPRGAAEDATPAATRIDLTERLQRSNLIEVALTAAPPALPCLSGAVHLEIV